MASSRTVSSCWRRSYTIRVKLGEDRWLECFGRDLPSAIQHWRTLAAKPPAESSGYYHSEWDTWYALKEYKKTLKQGS